MFYHIFTFDFEMDGMEPRIGIDCFHVTELPDLMNETTVRVARQIDSMFGEKTIAAIAGMQMRTRFANTPAGFDGVYVVKSKIELDREMLQMVLSAKQEQGGMMAFMEESKLEI